MNPNCKKIQIISAARADNRRHTARGVCLLKSLLRHVTTNALALVMFVAQALLSATHGKDSETRELASLKARKAEVVIDQSRFSSTTLTEPACATVTGTNHDKVPDVVMSVDSQFQESPVLGTAGLHQPFRDSGN